MRAEQAHSRSSECLIVYTTSTYPAIHAYYRVPHDEFDKRSLVYRFEDESQRFDIWVGEEDELVAGHGLEEMQLVARCLVRYKGFVSG